MDVPFFSLLLTLDNWVLPRDLSGFPLKVTLTRGKMGLAGESFVGRMKEKDVWFLVVKGLELIHSAY